MTAVQERYWCTGHFLPVDTENTTFDLPITGNLPDQLVGRVLRMGPNPVGELDPETYHWMVGDGMIHGIRLRDGKAEWYRNRWIRSPEVSAALNEPARPGKPIPQVLLPGGEKAPNTNVITQAGRTFALMEGALTRPYEVTFELETCGPSDFDGTLPEGYCAHPKRDPDTGEFHGISWNPLKGNLLQYSVLGADGLIKHIADIPTNKPTVVHDTSITKNYVVIYDLPTVFDITHGLKTGLPVMYDVEAESRVGIMPLSGTPDSIRWFSVPSCAMYHAMNAYEDGDEVILDVVCHPSAPESPLGMGEGHATLDRWSLNMATGVVTETRIDDRPQEMPRIDGRTEGRPYRFGWSAATGPVGGFAPGSTLLQYDMIANSAQSRDFGPGRWVSEAIYVAAGPDAAAEAGYVMTFVFDPDRGASDLVILQAGDFGGDPVAVVHLPVRVPHTFHGNWSPDA